MAHVPRSQSGTSTQDGIWRGVARSLAEGGLANEVRQFTSCTTWSQRGLPRFATTGQAGCASFAAVRSTPYGVDPSSLVPDAACCGCYCLHVWCACLVQAGGEIDLSDLSMCQRSSALSVERLALSTWGPAMLTVAARSFDKWQRPCPSSMEYFRLCRLPRSRETKTCTHQRIARPS